MTRYFGVNTSIVIWLNPSGLNELLLFWMTCLRWSVRPEDWESEWASRLVEDLQYSSETNLTTGISRMSGIGYKIWKALGYKSSTH